MYEVLITAECAYGVRYVEFTNRNTKPPWSLRQYSVYHKHIPGVNAPCSTWVLVGQSQRTETALDRYLQDGHGIQDAHPFELHIIFLDVAIASWRPYLAYLLEQEAQVVRVVTYECEAMSSANENSQIRRWQ